MNTIIHAFHPGDYVLLWGTGLGAISASDAEPPPAGNLPVSITVHVGNATASPTYQGRAPCCAGLDQIVFQVPQGIQGCYVPVGIESGGVVGSITTIAVSTSGQTCSDSILGQDLVSKLASGGKVDFGYVRLESYIVAGLAPILAARDFAIATFSEVDSGLAGMAEYGVSSGYCYTVDCSQGCGAVEGAAFSSSLSDSSPAQLDAGGLALVAPPAAVQPSGASIPLTQHGGLYEALLSGSTASRILWSQLAYSVTGQGGANVGSFSVSHTTSNPTIQFSDLAANQAIPRSSDLQILWSGGSSTLQNGQVTIAGESANSDFSQVAMLQCTAPLSGGQFTIPAWVLSSLPASGSEVFEGVTYPFGWLFMGQYNTPTVFNASGLDRGVITDIFYRQSEVNFQ